MDDTTCTLRHDITDKRLDGHDKRLDEVEHRQDVLEQSSVRTDTVVTNLCKKMDLLISVLLSCTGALLIALLTFFIWYIQKL